MFDVLGCQGVVCTQFQRAFDGLDQVVGIEGFPDIADGPGMDSLEAALGVVLPGDEDKGGCAVFGTELALELESGHFGHGHIEDKAAPWGGG